MRSITLESASFPMRVHRRTLPSNVPGKEDRVYRESLDVVEVVSPWNFSLRLTQCSVAPALALGSAVVTKPANDTPVTDDLLAAHIFEEAGVPAGVISMLVSPSAEIGDAFVEYPVPEFIFPTDSTPVGANINRIASGDKHLKHVALELSGNSPFVVLASADLEQTVAAAVTDKFLHQGQICIAIDRIVVEDTLYDRLVERYTERIRALKVGDPGEPGAMIGPIIDRRQLDTLLDEVTWAKEEGARPIVEGDARGQLLPPHVSADVTAEMEITREEIFGLLVGVRHARDGAHTLALANDSEFGPSSAVFTADLEHDVRFAHQIKAGMTHVNDVPVNNEAHAPFGGEKNSGLGRFNGEWAIEEFTTDHWISMQTTPRKYPFQHTGAGPFQLAPGPANLLTP